MTNEKTYRVMDLVWDIRSTTFEVKDGDGEIQTHKIQGRTVELKLDTTSKLVLLMLASHANAKRGFSCFLLHSTLANECLIDQKTVGRKLALLKEMGLISWRSRDKKSCLFLLKVARIREFSDPQRAKRKAERASQIDAENTLIDGNQFENPLDDTSALDAPAPSRPDTNVPRPLIESLTSIEINGVYIPEIEAESIARTLMNRFPDPAALLSAITSLGSEEMERVNAARKPSGMLITIIEGFAREGGKEEPEEFETEESDSDLDEYLADELE